MSDLGERIRARMQSEGIPVGSDHPLLIALGAPPLPSEADCTCTPDGGCDEEGDPGCSYCQSLPPEDFCPADTVADL